MIGYARAKSVFPNSNIVDTIDNTDIRQMYLGDCYFLASCSAVAEYPNRFANSFVSNKLPAEGIVQLKPFVLGVQKTLTLDDYLPFIKSSTGVVSKNLAFAQPSPSGELWGPFLEKTFAKVNGNYEKIESGWMSEVMAFLTGAPSKNYYSFANSMSQTAVWDLIVDADAKKLIITAGTYSATSDTVVNGVGLAMSHAYTVIGAYTLKNSDGSVKDYLFQMRNPWGEDAQYNGTYRDTDPIWTTSNYAAQVNFVSNAHDGIFFITL
jgi:hypothetical protein